MISGLVAYLSADAALAAAALREIERQPQLEIGPREQTRLPLVLETTTSDETQTVTDWLKDLPGVAHVDVAFVHLEETTART